MRTETTLTEADILTEVVEPNRLTRCPQLAEELLSFRFNGEANDRTVTRRRGRTRAR